MTQSYSGLTVNERLHVSGLMDQFEDAVQLKHPEKVREILKQVELTEESIEPILSDLFEQRVSRILPESW